MLGELEDSVLKAEKRPELGMRECLCVQDENLNVELGVKGTHQSTGANDS
jgi:hypothetical protein